MPTKSSSISSYLRLIESEDQTLAETGFSAARPSLATAAEQTVSTSVVGECDDKMIIYSLRE